jgi:general secretion pathway protein L
MIQKRILLYLNAEEVSYLIMDEAGKIRQTVMQGNLADLTPLTGDHELHVIVPGQAVLLTAAKLPKLNSQRLMQALPFALEEQLIDDVNQLHFSIGEHQPDESIPVAIVAKEKMDAWLAKLKEANIFPSALVPVTLALPFEPDHWYACIYDDIGIVRTGHYSGFTCDKENLNTLLELRLAQAEKKPQSLYLQRFSDTSMAIQLDGITVNETTLDKNQFLDYVSQGIKKYPFLNLLQGNYQAKQKTALTKKMGMIASYLFLAWAGFIFLSNLGSFFILHHSVAVSEQLIDNIYQRHFPHASSVVAPRQRMEEKLKKLSAMTNKNNFLSMLGIATNSLAQANDVRLLSLDFHDNQLVLGVAATTSHVLDDFIRILARQGLTVKQQNATVAGGTVKASVLISQGVL